MLVTGILLLITVNEWNGDKLRQTGCLCFGFGRTSKMTISLAVYKAGIPRRRRGHGHGHRHRLVKRGYSLTSDARCFLTRIFARKSRVSDVRMYRRVGRVGVGVRISVSAPWNASQSWTWVTFL